jgi:hypothetical protein
MKEKLTTEDEERYLSKIALNCGVPDYMCGALVRYVFHGINPGDFLTAIICNDLFEALSCADETNINKLRAYGIFFYNHVPSACFGSAEKMEQWIISRRK